MVLTWPAATSEAREQNTTRQRVERLRMEAGQGDKYRLESSAGIQIRSQFTPLQHPRAMTRCSNRPTRAGESGQPGGALLRTVRHAHSNMPEETERPADVL